MTSLLARYLARAAATRPAATALIAGGETFSFAALPAVPAARLPPRLAALLRGPELPGRAELLIATSGSTGEPKTVMLSAANLEAAVLAAKARIPLAPGDVWLNCLPLRHIGGMAIFYRCAEAGAAVLLHPGFDADSVRSEMALHGVTHVSLVPPMLARLLEAGPPPARLKSALVGGGPLSAALARRARDAGWPLCPTYGMSEAASQVATLAGLPPDWREGMVGPPLPGMEVAIAADGRIRIRGAMVMTGYAPHGSGLDADGWFSTGDRGYLDPNGNLVVWGRCDEMLVSGGVNVHPGEVEGLLLACPGVRDAAVTAVGDDTWGARIAALLVGEASAESARLWCREHLPSHLRPRLFVKVSALPRTSLGKLERARLPGLV